MAHKNAAAQPRRRAPRSARDLILKAATEAFLAHGYAGVSIDEIAAQAGVSKPTIYSHFQGKEQLFTAIMNAICDNFEEPFLGPNADAEELSTILVQIANNYTRAILVPGVLAMHRLFVAEAQRFPELSRRYFEAGPRRVHNTLAKFFKKRMARGEIRKCDPLLLAQFFAAVVIAPMRMRRLFAVAARIDWKAMDQQNREAIALFLDGCRWR